MKKKMHLFKKTIIFGLVFILFSCEKDLYDNYLESNKHNLLVQRKDFEDLKKDKALMKSIEKFTLQSKNSLNREYYDTINNFYIDLDNVMFTLDSLNNQTYTFKVNRIPDNGLFENLILKSSQTGDFDAVLAQYNQNLINLTSTSPQGIENAINQYATFTYLGKKTIAEINNKFSINEECFEPGYIYVQGDQCASGNHSFSEGSACTYWGSTNMATTGGYVFTMVPTKCDGGSEGATPPTNGSFSTGPHGGRSDILDVSQDFVPPCPGNPIDNPRICPSSPGNLKGGTYGCTRKSNTICSGVSGKKKHGGVDIEVIPLERLFVMYSGTVVSKRATFGYNQYAKNSLGNFVEIESLINGQLIRIKYNHLGAIPNSVNGYMQQGWPLGLSGKSGNAAAPGVTAHLHIQAKMKVGNSWVEIDPLPLFDTNFNPSTFQPSGSKTNCQ